MSEAENREWMYLRGGQQVGPVSLTELRQLAAAGQIQPQDNIWKAGMAQWAAAQTISGLFVSAPPPPPPPPPASPMPPVHADPDAAIPPPAPAPNGIRLAVLLMTIIAAFLSVLVGGCTASMGEGMAKFGENLSDLQKDLGDHGNASKTRQDAAKMRKEAGSFAGWGLLQGALGLAGGIWAYRNFTVAKALYWGGGAIVVAALISMHNLCSFCTAGLLDTVAGILALMRARSLQSGK